MQRNTKDYNLYYLKNQRKKKKEKLQDTLIWYLCWILNPKYIGIETSGNFTDCKMNLNDPVFYTSWLILVKLGYIFAICIPSRNCYIKENNCIQHYVKEANLFQRQHFLVVQRKEERRKLLKSYLLHTVFSGVSHWEKPEQCQSCLCLSLSF